jgi:hypothetical protein
MRRRRRVTRFGGCAHGARRPIWTRDPVNGTFFGLAFLAALNPKLLGVDLLLLENRRPRMMFVAFLAGGLATGIAVGVVDVLWLQVGSVRDQGSISAGLELLIGGALLAVGGLIATGRLRSRQKAPATGKGGAEKTEGWAERVLREPRPGLAVAVGALMGTPGASYIAALVHLVSGGYSTATQLAGVVVFNLIQFLIVIVPLFCLTAWPDGTERRLRGLSSWVSGHARGIIAGIALVVGAYAAISGFARLL